MTDCPGCCGKRAGTLKSECETGPDPDRSARLAVKRPNPEPPRHQFCNSGPAIVKPARRPGPAPGLTGNTANREFPNRNGQRRRSRGRGGNLARSATRCMEEGRTEPLLVQEEHCGACSSTLLGASGAGESGMERDTGMQPATSTLARLS